MTSIQIVWEPPLARQLLNVFVSETWWRGSWRERLENIAPGVNSPELRFLQSNLLVYAVLTTNRHRAHNSADVGKHGYRYFPARHQYS